MSTHLNAFKIHYVKYLQKHENALDLDEGFYQSVFGIVFLSCTNGCSGEKTRYKLRGYADHFSAFSHVNKFDIIVTGMIDSIIHMTLKLLRNRVLAS